MGRIRQSPTDLSPPTSGGSFVDPIADYLRGRRTHDRSCRYGAAEEAPQAQIVTIPFAGHYPSEENSADSRHRRQVPEFLQQNLK
jgi:hypothetical protein